MTLEITRFLEAPGRRLSIDLSLPGGRLDQDDLRDVEHIRVIGEAFAQHGVLFVEATIEARIVQPCSRCLEPTTTALSIAEEIEVPIAPASDLLDLTPEVLRLVLSSHDPNVICRPDCRGLCAVCGANLNENADHACAKQHDDRTRLKDLLT
ncbi:DUF177 domain-containing protein [Candidatus Bipolaricaulota bacterium]|nr:DUF177 domain-containing protein [Candidatus Bipolaricaulota bacterium]